MLENSEVCPSLCDCMWGSTCSCVEGEENALTQGFITYVVLIRPLP